MYLAEECKQLGRALLEVKFQSTRRGHVAIREMHVTLRGVVNAGSLVRYTVGCSRL
jgi:hypothetical protein